jgi:hypothetical protein
LDKEEVAELLVTISKKLGEQEEKTDAAESVAKRAGQGKVILSALGMLIGLLVGAGGALIFLNDEWRDWKELKAVHQTVPRETTGVVLLDHADLHESEITAIMERMDLPDFSEFARIADIPNIPDPQNLIRYGDEVKLRYASNPSQKYMSSVDFNVVTGDKYGLWALEK